MIIDFTVSNFRSFDSEQMLSMYAEAAPERLPLNFTSTSSGIRVLRTAAILGPNASGKSNILRAFGALRWIIMSSAGRREAQHIPAYEPFRLSSSGEEKPTTFDIEFIVPSGFRYRYNISIMRDQIIQEKLISYSKTSRAVLFERRSGDSWKNVKFGGNYKGGSRRFSFFENAAYLSRAGNDASSPDFMREIYKYFSNLTYMPAGATLISQDFTLENEYILKAVSKLICLADTGIDNIALVENENFSDLRIPENIPEELKDAILAHNKFTPKFWLKSKSGDLIDFSSEDMSDGTNKLMHVLPAILVSLKMGSVLIFDEIDSHLHRDLVSLILSLYHDDDMNPLGAQLIFSTHDVSILNSQTLRRDQIWFVNKDQGESFLRSLDSYDKKYVRHDSPFEAFYRDGRLGALPKLSHASIKASITDFINNSKI